jgi:hypothetical protein
LLKDLYRRYFYSPVFRNDDVFLVSFPRSGNTWLRYMLTLLHPGLRETDSRDIHWVIPNLDQAPDLKATPIPRVIKSHSLFNPRYPRVIYLLRDGRDATHSYYLFCRKEYGYEGSFEMFLEQRPFFRWKWHEHVESWLSGSHETPLLVVRYEDMLVDVEKQLRRVLDFLGWKPADGEIRQAVQGTQIERMRHKESTGSFLAHVGQGRAGIWSERFSDGELALFMCHARETLLRFGYPVS